MRGYKAMNRDMTCHGFKFEVGKRYKHNRGLSLCSSGFHFCKRAFSVFEYYEFNFDKTIVCEIISHGDVLHDEKKYVTNDIEIMRVIPNKDLLKLINAGYHNTGCRNAGDHNTGDRNAGDHNTGDWNTGGHNVGNRNPRGYYVGAPNAGYEYTDCGNTGYHNTGDHNVGDHNTGYHNVGNHNTGDRNIGDWNTGHGNTGFFNTKTSDTILVFGKETSVDVWVKSYKPDFLFFDLTELVDYNDMTEDEKQNNQSAKTTSGYLKQYDYKEAFIKSWEAADHEDRIKIKDLPNFDYDMFYEISGIDVKKYEKE